MNKVWKGIAAAALALALVGCGATTVVTSGEGSQSLNTITVSSTAEVRVTPDMARINVGVTTQGTTADEAEAANTELLEAVMTALAEQGVAEESIQTSWTNLYPVYGYASDEADVEAYNGAMMWEPANDIVGYEMTTELTVSDLTVEQVGDVIQAVVNVGANRVDGVSYYSSQYDAAYAEALGQAVTNARPKAETIASAAGVGLGSVVQVTEGYQNRMYAYEQVEYETDAVADAGGGVARAIAVAPGTVTVEASVTVTYAIG